MVIRLRTVALSIILAHLVHAVQIPPSFKICNRTDPHLNKCLKKSIKHVFPLLVDGFPELKLPSIDPYVDKENHLEYKLNQISIEATLWNISVVGFSKAKILDVRADIQDDSFELEMDVFCKNLFTEGSFEASGGLNALTIDSDGYFNCSMENSKWRWKLTGSPVERKGNTYLKITKFFAQMDAESLYVHMSDLLPGNAELSKFMREFVNSNWKILYAGILPFAEYSWDRIGRKFSNKIFGKIPYDELFPFDPDE